MKKKKTPGAGTPPPVPFEKLVEQTEERLGFARFKAVTKWPYFAQAIYSLVPKVIPELAKKIPGPIACSAAHVLLVDPEWALSVSTDTLAAAMVHEVMHILQDHHKRSQEFPDKDRWNIACDLTINPVLLETGWTLPSWVAVPEKYSLPKGKTAEEYYRLLSSQQTKQQAGKGDAGEGNQGSGKGSGKGNGDQQGKPTFGAGACGGAAGNPTDFEKQFDAEIGRDSLDQEIIKQTVARDMQQHQAAHGRGSVPGCFQELIDQLNQKSLVPWQARLRAILKKSSGRIIAGSNDFSMARPSKRSYTRGIIRPSTVDQEVEILFVEDTSGSMGMDQSVSARVEAAAIFKALGVEQAWWVSCDAAVADVKRVALKKIASMPIVGRGGTDFRPAIEAAVKLKPKPDIIVYLTDGDGPAPECPPRGIEVVWCIVPTPYGRKPANWGHLVVCDNNQELAAPYYL